MKKLAAFLLCLLCALTLCFSASASDDAFEDFTVTSDNGITLKLWECEDSYYLFIPSDTDTENLTVTFPDDKTLILNGTVKNNGDTVSLKDRESYELVYGEKHCSLLVLKSSELPSLHITTKSASMSAVHADKSHKEPANIVIYDDGEVVLEKDLDYIKGRGNTSWTYAKKPYNIKFEKKTALFGMDKAKKWTLLANYVDKTLLRNHTALSLATELGIPFTSQHTFVDLYINNEYYGNYVLCESVETGDGRVEITDLTDATEEANPDIDIENCDLGGQHEKDYHKLTADTQKWVNIPNNPMDITGGYLLEYELPYRYVDEVSGFVTKRNQPITLKEPEYASEAQVKYISNLYQQFEDALYSDTGCNYLGKHYSEYIDFDSFVMMYIFQEFTKNLDAATTSFYIYKDADSDVFVAAPVWDFDRALGSSTKRYGVDTGNPEGWWAGITYHLSDNDIYSLPTMLNALYRKDDFFAAACEKWSTSFTPVLNDKYIDELSDLADKLTPAAVMNAVRWKTYSTKDYQSVATAYRKAVDESLLKFISERKSFLDKGLSASSVRVFFDPGTGKGNMFNEKAFCIGEALTLPECTFTHPYLIFDCWNTAADGSGASYTPGEAFVLKDGKTTFYAQWKEKPEEIETPGASEENLSFFQRLIKSITDFFKRILDFFKNIF
ncbi:MAG: CotH kinase family protein [Clostridia bacterium]|nr:CotH kinase family protein [Clostridia bacterium]